MPVWSAPRRERRGARTGEAENEPHVKSHGSLYRSRTESASKITTISKTMRLPRSLHFEVTPLRSLAHVTKSRMWTPQNTRFPLRLRRKVTTLPKNAHGTTTRGQWRQAPATDTQILRACAVEMHFEDFERHEQTKKRDTSIRHRPLTITVRTPSVTTLFGEKLKIWILRDVG